MSDIPALSSLALPPALDADEAIGLRDQMAARIAAVVRPKGQKPPEGEPRLPEGVHHLKALPPHLEKPWVRFDSAINELQTFRTARASAQADAAHASAEASEKDASNASSDDRWRSFEKWVGACASLADDGLSPPPSDARWLYAQLFTAPDGLRFITRRPRAQWSAMEQRMSILRGERAQAIITAFGGQRYWDQLSAAHDRFGKAYGFMVALPPEGPTDGRPQWLAARDALRTLIQKIESHADVDIEGSEALAEFLLGPYMEMVDDHAQGRRPSRAKKPDTVTEPSASKPETA